MVSLLQVSVSDIVSLDSDLLSQDSPLSQGSQEDSPDTALLEAAKLWSLAEVEMKSSDLLQVAKSVLRWRTRSCPPVREAGAALDEMTGSQDLESGRTAAAQILLLRYTIQCVGCSVQRSGCSVQRFGCSVQQGFQKRPVYSTWLSFCEIGNSSYPGPAQPSLAGPTWPHLTC